MSHEAMTERQEEIYGFIREKIRSRGYGPTVREIGEHFQISSPNGVMCHLKALEKKGLIDRQPNKSRAIQLSGPWDEPGLPLVGRIAAGPLTEAIEQCERIDLAELFDPEKDMVALQVTGDSMIEDHIADGDMVIVKRQHTAKKGQVVVAETEDGDATLKRWYPETNRIRLQPSNSTMKPIYVKNAKIYGVVVGVIRKLG